jgi:VCBS repeat-containing protein
VVGDDALGSETLSLSGADAASFEIRNGTELFYVGASPDFESQAAYSVTVSADDTSVGATPDAAQAFTLTVTDVNEAPTAVDFANTITLAENTDVTGGIKVADILVVDDALGSETLSLSGADAASFEIRNGTELFYIDTSPNYEVKSAYDVTVSADDTSVGGTPDASQAFTLTITDVNEAPVAQNDTNAGDAVIEDTRSILNIVLDPGDPTATGNVLTNDSDPDGNPLSVAGVAAGTPGTAPSTGVGSPIVGTYGSLTVAAGGTWNYALDNLDPDTAALGQLGQPASGQDIFTYAVSDGAGGISTATIAITVQGALDVVL